MESLSVATVLDWLAFPWVQGPIAFVLWVGLLLIFRDSTGFLITPSLVLLGDSSIDTTAFLGAREFSENYRAKNEFVKRLHACFRSGGIAIPFPIRALDLPDRHIARLRDVPAAEVNAGPARDGARPAPRDG